MGDLFAWFVKNCVPESYIKEAEEKGFSRTILRPRGEALVSGETAVFGGVFHADTVKRGERRLRRRKIR